MKLNGKTALVTGASRGMGAQIARTLAAGGANVIVNYNRSSEAAQQVVADIESRNGKAVAVQADVSDLEAGRALVAEAERRFGGLDILISNAGAIANAPLSEITPEQYEQQFATNVQGLLFLTQAAAKIMRDGGRIINISSVAAAGKFPTYSVYAASKAAANAFTSVWARELGGRGITVNSVSPGPVETDMMWAVNTQESVDAMAAMSPLGRIAQPADIANVVVFLASDEARWITGRDILTDGGLL
jgi:3-oxoacyl-[acyl-carrier protein] reductase